MSWVELISCIVCFCAVVSRGEEDSFGLRVVLLLEGRESGDALYAGRAAAICFFVNLRVTRPVCAG